MAKKKQKEQKSRKSWQRRKDDLQSLSCSISNVAIVRPKNKNIYTHFTFFSSPAAWVLVLVF